MLHGTVLTGAQRSDRILRHELGILETSMSLSPDFSALNAETQTWPILTEAEIDRSRPPEHVRQVAAGDIVYASDVAD